MIAPTKDEVSLKHRFLERKGRLNLGSLRIKSQSQSYIATDGRSISKSWCRAPSGAHDQIFITV
jgi:hypothetical protein